MVPVRISIYSPDNAINFHLTGNYSCSFNHFTAEQPSFVWQCTEEDSKTLSSPLSHTEFLQMAVNFEECRKKWLRADEELVSCKEVLAKLETDRGALEVKLKHARNQVDVEIRRRQKAEAVYEKLVGVMLLISLVSVHMLTSCNYH